MHRMELGRAPLNRTGRLSIAGDAFARGASGPSTITLCIPKGAKSVVHFPNSKGACAHGQTKVSLVPSVLPGPAGVRGDTGATGAAGPHGDTGTIGAIGATGATGTRGAKGGTGATGASGGTIISGAGAPRTRSVTRVTSNWTLPTPSSTDPRPQRPAGRRDADRRSGPAGRHRRNRSDRRHRRHRSPGVNRSYRCDGYWRPLGDRRGDRANELCGI